MKKIELGQTIVVLANLGVLAGIVILGIEIRQARVAIQDNSHLGAYEYNVATMELLYRPEFNEIYNRGLGNYEALNAAEAHLFTMYVGSRLNLWEYVFWADQRGAAPAGVLDGWDAWFLTQMSQDAWRQQWEARKTRQGDEFIAHVDQLLSSE